MPNSEPCGRPSANDISCTGPAPAIDCQAGVETKQGTPSITSNCLAVLNTTEVTALIKLSPTLRRRMVPTLVGVLAILGGADVTFADLIW